MPTYEYACSSCETRHDIVQAMTDDALTVCPSCNEPSLRKLFGNVGVVFKGSGFYRTDSRDSGKSTSSSSDSKSESKSTSTSDSTSSSGSGSGSDSSSSPSSSSSSSSSSTSSSTPAATSP